MNRQEPSAIPMTNGCFKRGGRAQNVRTAALIRERWRMNLTQLAAFFDRQHTPVDGCNLSAQEAAITAHEKYSPRPFCLVSQWTILDLHVGDEELNALRSRGLEPVVVYASCVVLDTRRRYQPSDWVRSSFQTSYEAPSFFLTKNTVYVLLGRGKRQVITVDDLSALSGQ